MFAYKQVAKPTGDNPTGDTPKRRGGPNVLYFVLYLFCFLSFFTDRNWKASNHMFNGSSTHMISESSNRMLSESSDQMFNGQRSREFKRFRS